MLSHVVWCYTFQPLRSKPRLQICLLSVLKNSDRGESVKPWQKPEKLVFLLWHGCTTILCQTRPIAVAEPSSHRNDR